MHAFASSLAALRVLGDAKLDVAALRRRVEAARGCARPRRRRTLPPRTASPGSNARARFAAREVAAFAGARPRPAAPAAARAQARVMRLVADLARCFVSRLPVRRTLIEEEIENRGKQKRSWMVAGVPRSRPVGQAQRSRLALRRHRPRVVAREHGVAVGAGAQGVGVGVRHAGASARGVLDVPLRYPVAPRVEELHMRFAADVGVFALEGDRGAVAVTGADRA